MIEPIVGDKKCSSCGDVKPVTAFSVRSKSKDGRHAHCKQCRRLRANQKTSDGARSDYKRKRDKPTSWLLPSDPRPFGQKLAAATQRRWRYAVEPVQNLTWRLAA